MFNEPQLVHMSTKGQTRFNQNRLLHRFILCLVLKTILWRELFSFEMQNKNKMVGKSTSFIVHRLDDPELMKLVHDSEMTFV